MMVNLSGVPLVLGGVFLPPVSSAPLREGTIAVVPRCPEAATQAVRAGLQPYCIPERYTGNEVLELASVDVLEPATALIFH